MTIFADMATIYLTALLSFILGFFVLACFMASKNKA
jgi:hypothetical protein